MRGKERISGLEELTGGPSSGGMIIRLFPPGFMSRIPSSNPAEVTFMVTTSPYLMHFYL